MNDKETHKYCTQSLLVRLLALLEAKSTHSLVSRSLRLIVLSLSTESAKHVARRASHYTHTQMVRLHSTA